MTGALAGGSSPLVALAAALWVLLAVCGLHLAVVRAGLPVLGQGAFVAVGALGTALLGPGGQGWPLGLAAASAVAVAVVAGMALGATFPWRGAGAPAAFALGTWTLAWAVDGALRASPGLSGGDQGRVLPSPARFVAPALGTELVLTPALHVVVAGLLAALVLGALARAERGPGGGDLLALRSGEGLARSLGLPAARRRRAVLGVSAGLAGLAGSGSALLAGVVAPADLGPLLSLQLLVAALAGAGAAQLLPARLGWSAPVLGVALLCLLAPATTRLAEAAGLDATRLSGLVAAVVLGVVLAVRRLPVGAPARTTGAAGVPASAGPLVHGAAGGAGGVPPAAREVLLEARGVGVRFGGLVALEGVDLVLRAGEVHGLLGPNGSGKSTLLAVLAGEVHPGEGEVVLAGRPVAPAQRVAAGVARLPQDPPATREPVTALAAARAGSGATRLQRVAVARHLLATPGAARARRVHDRVAAGALAAARVDGTLRAGRLDHAAARRVQLAQVLATGGDVVLLDEPAAGCSTAERALLAEVVRDLARSGRAVLLVEHDVPFVARLADRLTVLDAGRVVATGEPAAVRADPAVRRAYLGEAP